MRNIIIGSIILFVSHLILVDLIVDKRVEQKHQEILSVIAVPTIVVEDNVATFDTDRRIMTGVALAQLALNQQNIINGNTERYSRLAGVICSLVEPEDFPDIC